MRILLIHVVLFLWSLTGQAQGVVMDSTWIEGHYLSDCRLHVRESLLPKISGFPDADIWNSRFERFFDRTISESCVDVRWEPRLKGESDTVTYVGFHFYELEQNDSLLSLHCGARFKAHGGTAWWLEHEIFNIDLRSGKPYDFPERLKNLAPQSLDATICDHFEEMGACFEPYDCHSCNAPGFLTKGIAQRHLGIKSGQWILYEMMWPSVCAHVAQSLVPIPLGWADSRLR